MFAGFQYIASNVAASLATVGAVVAAMDYFLSKNQKSWLENKNLAIWYWLSERSASAAIGRYKNEFMFNAFLKYTMLGFGIASLLFSPIIGSKAVMDGLWYIFFGFINAFVVTAILKIKLIYKTSYSIYRKILDIRVPIILFMVSLALQVLWAISWFGFVVLLHFGIGEFFSDDAFGVIILMISTFIVPVFTSYLAICILSTNFLIISIASLVYTSLEWFVRKSAESDKGIVLGASAVLGAMSTFLKSVS